MGFAEEELQGHLVFGAEDSDADGVAGLVLVHEGANILRVGDLLSVDGDDEVAAQHDGGVADIGLLVATVEACALGRSAGDNALNQDAVIGIEAHLRGEIGTDGIGDDAERGSADAAVTGEIGKHGFGGVDGDGKANA